LPVPAPPESRAPVAFFSNGNGDRLLSLPALRALVCLYGTRLTLLCDEGAAPFFRTELELTNIVEIPHSGIRQEFDAAGVARAIGGCDLFLSLVPWCSEDLARLVEAVAPRLSVGFAPLFDVPLARNYGKHSADLAFDLPRSLDPSLRIDAFAGPLRFAPAVRRRTDRLLAPLPAGIRVLTLHADTLPAKTWRGERMAQVIDRFLADHGDFVVFVVGMCDCTFRGDRSRPRVVDCCGLPLDLTMQLVAASDLFLGIDSCMLHAADLGRVPGVGLFGPTSSVEFGFRFGPHRHVQAESMDDVTVEDVSAALTDMWSSIDSPGLPRRHRRGHGGRAGRRLIASTHARC
jgi:hypothetical protein